MTVVKEWMFSSVSSNGLYRKITTTHWTFVCVNYLNPKTFKNNMVVITLFGGFMPENGMLIDTAIGEQLSYAYIHAVASKAGFSFERRLTDKDSIDASIHAKGKLTPESIISPSIELQAKSTTNYDLHDDDFRFPLKVEYYNALRGNRFNPTILVVLFLPENIDDWLSHSEEMLITKKCAYWISLKDMLETSNKSTVTIKIPKSNVFSPTSLMNIMTNVSIRRSVI